MRGTKCAGRGVVVALVAAFAIGGLVDTAGASPSTLAPAPAVRFTLDTARPGLARRATSGSTTTTLTPAQSSAYVASPGRGQYLWYPDDHPSGVPASVTANESYARYSWRDLEPTPGAYNLAEIDRQLAAARARGGTFSFRVMPVCGWCGADALPADVSAAPGSWTTALGDGGTVRVPDWNGEAYLSRWEGLMAELGRRYDADPRLGHVDVGGYGNWGERHNWPYEGQYPGPGGQLEATPTSLARIVGAVVGAFPGHVVSLNPLQVKAGSGPIDPALSWQVMRAALASSRRVGLRNDCLGGGTVQQSAVDLLADAQARAVAEGVTLLDRPLDRWRVAPLITEWCNNIAPGSTDGTFAQGAAQVESWHVSLLSNGNFTGALSSYDAAAQSAFVSANTKAGYRLGVSRAVVTAAAGAAPTVALTWVNSGVAPVYRAWQVRVLLVDSLGRTAASAVAATDLSTLLGGGSARTDTTTLVASAALKGTYTLRVLVTDPAGYFTPLGLTSGARGSDGSYQLGTVRF